MCVARVWKRRHKKKGRERVREGQNHRRAVMR